MHHGRRGVGHQYVTTVLCHKQCIIACSPADLQQSCAWGECASEFRADRAALRPDAKPIAESFIVMVRNAIEGTCRWWQVPCWHCLNLPARCCASSTDVLLLPQPIVPMPPGPAYSHLSRDE